MAHGVINESSVKVLNDGTKIPVLGLGTWPLTVGAEGVVSLALQQGYRMIDTASSYEYVHYSRVRHL